LWDRDPADRSRPDRGAEDHGRPTSDRAAPPASARAPPGRRSRGPHRRIGTERSRHRRGGATARCPSPRARRCSRAWRGERPGSRTCRSPRGVRNDVPTLRPQRGQVPGRRDGRRQKTSASNVRSAPLSRSRPAARGHVVVAVRVEG
jgi:hypothetical protein